MAIDSYRHVVIGDREGEDIPVKLFLTLNQPEKLDNRLDGKGHAIRILLVCDVKRCSTVLDFVGKEGKVYVVYGYKEGHVHDVA